MTIITVILILPGSGCSEKKTNISFYYWRTIYDPSDQVLKQLEELNVQRLYIRYFDVVKSDRSPGASPDAVIKFKKKVAFDVVPVVYIRSNVFEGSMDIRQLAVKVNDLISAISKEQSVHYSEIQVDCDWNESSKDRYFEFLEACKEVSGRTLSVTIRLHQVKYKEITGIPPCDKGVLMFYNMGDLSGGGDYMYSEKRSLQYVSYLNSYPLTLDPALPFYEHVIAYRSGKAYKILKPSIIRDNIHLFSKADGRYVADSAFFFGGEYVRKGDIFKIESSRNELVYEAAELLSSNFSRQSANVIFYDVPDNKQSEEVFSTIKEAGSLFN